jgi:hypothetical protein
MISQALFIIYASNPFQKTCMSRWLVVSSFFYSEKDFFAESHTCISDGLMLADGACV